MKNQGAPLIYTKTLTCGFRHSFVVQPEDFTPSEAEKYLEFIQAALAKSEDLRSEHMQRQIVLADGRYVVLGVVGYLRDFSDVPRSDSANRPIQGFMGLVFKQDEFGYCSFPGHDLFRALLDEHIFSHWEDSPNSNWANTVQLCGYRYTVAALAKKPGEELMIARIFPAQKNPQVISNAILMAANGRSVSVCTNQSEINDGREMFSGYSLFGNMSVGDGSQTRRMQIEEKKPAANKMDRDLTANAQESEQHKLPLVIAAALVLSVIVGIIFIPSTIVKGLLGLILVLTMVVCVLLAVQGAKKVQRAHPITITADRLQKSEIQSEKRTIANRPQRPAARSEQRTQDSKADVKSEQKDIFDF